MGGCMHRRPRLRLRLTVLMLAVALSLAACGTNSASQAGQQELIPIRIGVPISNYWPAYVAHYQGFYRQAGLDPTFISFTTGAPLIAALKSGSIDAVFTGLATLYAVHQGIPLTYLYTPLDSSSQEGLVVASTSEIASYKEIAKAEAIAAPTATCAQIAFVTAARSAGVDPQSLNRVNLAPELMLNAFKKGDIDAAFIWGPWSLLLESKGYPVVSWDPDYQPLGGVCATNVAARPSFLDKHPSAGCRLVKAHALTLKAAEKHPSWGPRSLVRKLNISRELAEKVYKTLEIPSLESQLDPSSDWSLTAEDGGLAARLYTAGKILAQVGVFNKPIPKQEILSRINPRPLQDYLSDRSCSLSSN